MFYCNYLFISQNKLYLNVDTISNIEDLTRVVISCEIYETSLWRVSYEMITSSSFWLSYDCLEWDFIAIKVDII